MVVLSLTRGTSCEDADIATRVVGRKGRRAWMDVSLLSRAIFVMLFRFLLSFIVTTHPSEIERDGRDTMNF
jgi:hypothetical protein